MYFDNLHYKEEIGVNFTELIWIYIPTTVDCPTCTTDPLTGLSQNINCPTCKGSGKSVTMHRNELRCQIEDIVPGTVKFIGGVPTGVVGDMVIQGRLQDKGSYESARDLEGSYIFIDSSTKVKPTKITKKRIRDYTALEVRCNIVKEDQT